MVGVTLPNGDITPEETIPCEDKHPREQTLATKDETWSKVSALEVAVCGY
jgi:hypothetical protein